MPTMVLDFWHWWSFCLLRFTEWGSIPWSARLNVLHLHGSSSAHVHSHDDPHVYSLQSLQLQVNLYCAHLEERKMCRSVPEVLVGPRPKDIFPFLKKYINN